ncbi:MAG: DUF4166 domain-containing protein [Pseudomonadales bacterium]
MNALTHSLCSQLPASQWARLPAAVQARFGQVFTPGRSQCYSGQTLCSRASKLGWLLAQLGRLIGAPLPLHCYNGPVVVTVTDHDGNGGQNWCRVYHKQRGFGQCIQSIKRFRGPTGLEEYLGFGLAMALRLSVEEGALLFRSAGFVLYLGALRVSLPAWLTPFELTVVHRELSKQRFEFLLDLAHPRFGELIHQRMLFCYDE